MKTVILKPLGSDIPIRGMTKANLETRTLLQSQREILNLVANSLTCLSPLRVYFTAKHGDLPRTKAPGCIFPSEKTVFIPSSDRSRSCCKLLERSHWVLYSLTYQNLRPVGHLHPHRLSQAGIQVTNSHMVHLENNEKVVAMRKVGPLQVSGRALDSSGIRLSIGVLFERPADDVASSGC